MRNKFLFSVSCIALFTTFPGLANAAAGASENEVIVVSATGAEAPIEATGKSITVIDRAEIESVQGPDIARVLERVPGISINRNGGIGATSAVRIRGSDNDQVLTLIDGVRVADPSSIGNGFDFTNLLPGNIERIEVLRGSNSTIWGSAAVGGVVLVTTEKGATGARISAEYGSRDSAYLDGSASLANDRFGITAYGSYFETEGFSALASGTEKDGFEQAAGGANAYFAITPVLTLRASGRYSDGTVEIDNFGDTEDTQDTQAYSGSASLELDLESLDVTATYSFADTERLSTSSFGPFIADGNLNRGDVRAAIALADPLTLHVGGYYEWTSFTSNFGGDAGLEQRGGYAQLGARAGDLQINAGVRLDDGTRFGSEVSFGADASYTLSDMARLHASYGEGFRAPGLFQLFDGFSGNPDLQPEDSANYDFGLEVGTRGGLFLFDITAFQRDIENQIEFDNTTFVFFNTESARARGIEMEATLRPTERLTILAAHTILGTELRSAPNQGNEQGRRPGQTLTLSADWVTPLAGLTIGGDVRAVSASFDRNDNLVELDAYEVVTLRASLPIADKIALFGRVENLFDDDYQTAAGFNTAGRGVFAGVRAKL